MEPLELAKVICDSYEQTGMKKPYEKTNAIYAFCAEHGIDHYTAVSNSGISV